MLQRNGMFGCPRPPKRSKHGAGALGFRDFPGLLTAKENRTGSRQTLLPICSFSRIYFPERNGVSSHATRRCPEPVVPPIGSSSPDWAANRLHFLDRNP